MNDPNQKSKSEPGKERVLSAAQLDDLKKEFAPSIKDIIKAEVKQAADENKIFELLRSELTYEANLITQRISWFVASQAFFFTSLAAALDRTLGVAFTLKNSLLFPMIPWIGLIVCAVILLSVLAAFSSADKTRNKMLQLANSPLAAQFPKRNILVILLGLLPSFLLPVVFAVCWIMILRG